jgi:hypothetical protein
MAQMSGFCAPFWMKVIIGPMSSPREKAFRSIPAQNPRPAPVSTPAVNPSSAFRRSTAAHNPCESAPLIAFMASGRFNVISSTRPRCSVSTASGGVGSAGGDSAAGAAGVVSLSLMVDRSRR